MARIIVLFSITSGHVHLFKVNVICVDLPSFVLIRYVWQHFQFYPSAPRGLEKLLRGFSSAAKTAVSSTNVALLTLAEVSRSVV